MNNEDVIRMAREAGFRDTTTPVVALGVSWEQVQRFAALVAASARAEENEACARLCDQMFHDWCNQEFEDEDEAYRNKPDAEDCKQAIRARGEK
jgi:hypothetical protein